MPRNFPGFGFTLEAGRLPTCTMRSGLRRPVQLAEWPVEAAMADMEQLPPRMRLGQLRVTLMTLQTGWKRWPEPRVL